MPFARWYRAAGAYPTGIYAAWQTACQVIERSPSPLRVVRAVVAVPRRLHLRFENRDELRERSVKGNGILASYSASTVVPVSCLTSNVSSREKRTHLARAGVHEIVGNACYH